MMLPSEYQAILDYCDENEFELRFHSIYLSAYTNINGILLGRFTESDIDNINFELNRHGFNAELVNNGLEISSN